MSVDRKYLLKEAQRTLDESDSTAAFCLCQRWILKDAITLLKKQEPKPVKVMKTEYDHKLYYCPRCDRPFCDFYYVKPKFCDKCGQAVKWNEI